MAQPPKPRGGGFVYFAKWKTYLNFAVLALGILFALPNLFTDAQLAPLREYVGVYKMSLGLDLRGGSHLLIEVDVQSVIRDRLEATKDEMQDLLLDAGITYQGRTVEGNAVVATLMNPGDAEKAREILQPLVEADMTLDIGSDGKLRLEITEPGIIARQARAVDQSIEIIRRRIDAEGVKEPSIQREGRDRILVQVPGYDDPKRLRELISTTAKMTFHFVDERYPSSLFEPTDAQVPPGDLKVQSVERNAEEGGEWYLIERRVMVSGENLVDASQSYDQQNQPVVDFKFDAIGARKFCDATTKGVGKLFAIKLDDKIISAPVIRVLDLRRQRHYQRQLHGAKRPTIWRCCSGPARCRRTWKFSKSAASAPSLAPTRSPPERWRATWGSRSSSSPWWRSTACSDSSRPSPWCSTSSC